MPASEPEREPLGGLDRARLFGLLVIVPVVIGGLLALWESDVVQQVASWGGSLLDQAQALGGRDRRS